MHSRRSLQKSNEIFLLQLTHAKFDVYVYVERILGNSMNNGRRRATKHNMSTIRFHIRVIAPKNMRGTNKTFIMKYTQISKKGENYFFSP